MAFRLAADGVLLLHATLNSLGERAGESGFRDSFIEHYILDVMYPTGLTSGVQWLLAGIVLAVNVAIYGWLLWRWKRRGPTGHA